MEQGRDHKKVYYMGSMDKTIAIETNRSIKRVMEIIERYTNYLDLEDDRKAIVRDTILNQINRLVRVTKHKQTVVFNQGEK